MATAQPGELRLEITRRLSAPPPVVFRACTEPEELAKWWGPEGFTTASVELDLRVGGSYRIAMQPPDGELFHLTGQFTQIDPRERLAYTFRWEPADPDDLENLVTLTFRDAHGATEVLLDHGPFATEERRALHDDGWSESLERLEAVVSPRP